ncbi:hypothetical protein JL720_6101 [Aureococcus anophagefferens]|nr:hypothetical protein JL720_6101 [Aureococcus anophagefferens]
MGDALERIVRECAAQAARSGRRVTLRVTIRGADVGAAVEFETVTVDERVGAARCAAAAQCAAPDAADGDFSVRVDVRAAGDDAGAHGVRAGKFCRFNEWARPGRLPQRRARGKRRKRSGAAEERRKRVWFERSCRRTRASNLIVAAVRRRAAQLLVAARETDDGCAGGAAWRRDGGRLSRVEATTTTTMMTTDENEDDPVMCSELKTQNTDKLCTGKLSAEDEVNMVAVEETDEEAMTTTATTMTTKTTDENEDDPRVDTIFDGYGGTLVTRLVRTIGVKEDKAKKVLRAYKQFLVLKAEGDDFDATKLTSASGPSAASSTTTPDGGADAVARATRIGSTHLALTKRFGNSFSKRIWCWTEPPPSKDPVESPTEKVAVVVGDPLHIRLRDQTGAETNYKIKTTTNLDKLFNAYAKRKGVNATSLRFYVDGRRVGYGPRRDARNHPHGERRPGHRPD